MIDSITLHNYRGHTETTIPCGRMTVLVGENAAGKTSVLRAAQWVSEGGRNPPAEVVRRGSSDVEVILTEHGPEGSHRTASARLSLDRQDTWQRLRAIDLDDALDGEAAFCPHAVFLSLNAEALAAPSVSKETVPNIDLSGRGLVSVLAYLKLVQTDRFQRIVDRLRAVVPIVRGIGFTRVAASETVQRTIRVENRPIELPETVTTIHDALLLDFADADKVPADLVNEGTLLTLGILTVLELIDRDGRPSDLVLIDDIDRALHPRAQRDLVTALRAVLDATPGLQILATSHSPYLIDALRPDEVVILGRDARGTIVAKRLDAFPDERLRKMLSTGELWMSEGDDWVRR